MLWIGVLVLIIAFLVYILLMPIDLIVDTIDNQYAIKLGFLGRLRIEKDENFLIRLRLHTLLTHFNFYPLKRRSPRKKDKKSKKREFKWSHLKLMRKLFRSFEIKKFALELDTGNCITNARLFPVFAFLNYRGVDCAINFVDRNSMVLHIQNRPIRILKSFINP